MRGASVQQRLLAGAGRPRRARLQRQAREQRRDCGCCACRARDTPTSGLLTTLLQLSPGVCAMASAHTYGVQVPASHHSRRG